jgi:hypothetical protein
VARELHGAIDDMRTAIDTLSSGHDGLPQTRMASDPARYILGSVDAGGF